MRSTLIVLLLGVLLSAQCKKEYLPGDYFGSAQAMLNNNTTGFNKTRGKVYNNRTDSVSLDFERWDGPYAREHLTFSPTAIILNQPQRIRKAPGNGNIVTSLYNTLSDDGDVICDVYYIYEPDSLWNYITVTAFNAQTKEIDGTFQATYLIDPSRMKCKPSAPDTIRIRNGVFHTKIL
jgi:hypothetical protein